ncbi:glutathione S-transferase N-terminal domain-containing protein [Shewanella sp. NIFS-20-20]|uniref:glutathione S-transferase N-terminal domain-containing protein n=1 Tax=Shewanella sp. NIFS-20-20 TaxID=2853806 RepID=UPI001C449E33|nr:glutathione S-transferase N-terminal domain-containing protein [Shewanella sp. NIFS-20-20]MBV7314651.1 glutathione S-transferase N-terminal domain-containing protein [Shewanella sp. NIFS-20-20]
MKTLLYSQASPYARMIRVMAGVLNITDMQLELVNPFDNSQRLLEANPLGKVPCLLLSDGSALFDSEVIARFIDHSANHASLFAAPGAEWQRQCQYALVIGMLDAAVALRQEQMRAAEGLASDFWRGRYEQSLLRSLRQIEHSGIIAACELNAERIALVCLLDYLDFRHRNLDWHKVVPAVAKWHQALSPLPVFADTRPS